MSSLHSTLLSFGNSFRGPLIGNKNILWPFAVVHCSHVLSNECGLKKSHKFGSKTNLNAKTSKETRYYRLHVVFTAIYFKIKQFRYFAIRAKETFIRMKMGQTVQFGVINHHENMSV